MDLENIVNDAIKKGNLTQLAIGTITTPVTRDTVLGIAVGYPAGFVGDKLEHDRKEKLREVRDQEKKRQEEAAQKDIVFPCYLAVGAAIGHISLDGTTAPRFVVRTGGQLFWLDDEQFWIWIRSLFYAGEAQLKSWLTEHNLSDNMVAKIEAMADSGLLLHFERIEDVNKVLSKIRLIPMGVGLGRSISNPDSFDVGDFEQRPLVRLDPLSYLIWAFSDGLSSIQDAIDKSCDMLSVETEVGTRRAGFLLPQLMLARVAYIDKVKE